MGDRFDSLSILNIERDITNSIDSEMVNNINIFWFIKN